LADVNKRGGTCSRPEIRSAVRFGGSAGHGSRGHASRHVNGVRQCVTSRHVRPSRHVNGVTPVTSEGLAPKKNKSSGVIPFILVSSSRATRFDLPRVVF
jgi:hypothetical protein